MNLEQSPVTGLLLAISALSTFTPRHYTHLLRQVVQPTWKMTIKRLPLGSIPFGSLGVSLTDVFCSVVLLYQMRTLERRWGSASYLAFVLTTAFAGSLALNIFVTEPNSPLSLDQLRILSSGGTIIPLVALAARYLREVPALQHWRIPITSLAFTERVSVIFPVIRLVFFPDTELLARTHKNGAIHVDIGIWIRILFALFGLSLSVASTRTPLLVWWLKFFSRRVCHPFIEFLRPASSALFGPKSVVEIIDPQSQQQQQTRQPMSGDGRYTVDNIASFQEVRTDYLPDETTMRRRRNQSTHRRRPSGRGETNSVAVNDEHIAQLLELGLGVDVEEIHAALVAANGDVDTAVGILVNRQ